MIFKQALIVEILKRRKQMTRRPVRQPRPAKRTNGTTYLTAPFVPTVGHTLPVQPGRGKHAVCHVRVSSVCQELAGDITYADARREGFRSTDDFKAYWVRLYDEAWINRELVDDRAACPCPDQSILVKRFNETHTDTLVWVIGFELIEDPDRFMGRQGHEDYTTTPARAIDLAPVPPEAYVDRLAEKARVHGEERRASFKRDLDLERQLQHSQRGPRLRRAA